jgi:hypothetical protein
MQRLGQYANNTGIGGIVKALVSIFVVVWGVIESDKMGLHWFSLPLLLAAFAIPYRFRDYLVDHLDSVRVVMNGCAISAILFVALRGDALDQNPGYWLPTILFTAFGLYWGCYFWMLSDRRIGVG